MSPTVVAFVRVCSPTREADVNISLAVKSPCIDVCELDERNICIGCRRTLDEIAVWSKLNEQQKIIVLENCAVRKSN